jgi:arginine decarboxylase
VLKKMQHNPDLILERLRQASETAIYQVTLQIEDARLLMSHFNASLDQTTSLEG